MGGLLTHFGLWDWYFSLSEDDRQEIISCYKNETTDPDDLFNGRIFWTSNTGCKLLSNLAYNALSCKNHRLSAILLDKAGEIVKSDSDRSHYEAVKQRIEDEKIYIPDQGEIEDYKKKVVELIRQNPGIVQSEVKKAFPEQFSVAVGHALSQLKYGGKIRREKKGSSFRLFLI